MKSDEIKKIVDCIKSGTGYYANNAFKPLSLEEINTLFVGEIAYQLAKLHEHFVMVDEHVFGDKKSGK